MRFSDIIGQEEIKKKLISTVRENRVSHAQLFLGPEGSGSLAIAIAYAQYLNCPDRSATDSCGQCASCRKYSKLIHPDLHFSYPFFAKKKEDTALDFITDWRAAFLDNPYIGLDYWRSRLNSENKQANINIAECHQIIKSLSLKPFESEFKVLIMWLPEYLDIQGNVLLKLIEEPPQKTLFLLVAENQDKILRTILSRTQIVKIPALKIGDVQYFLENYRNLNRQQAHEIAFLSEGNLNKVIRLISSEKNNHFDLLVQWLRLIVMDSGLDLLNFLDKMLNKIGRENQKSFLTYSINILREVIVYQSGADQLVKLPGAERVFVEKFSRLYSFDQVNAAISELEKAYYHIERNANPKILFLDVSLQLILFFKYQTFRKSADSLYI